MASKLCLATLLVLFSIVKGQLYDMEFEENGHTYKELINVDKQNQIVIYDVPNHGSIGAATYLKDFINRLTVMRVSNVKKCYVWKMEKDEPTPDSVVNGLKKNHFKFPQGKYWIVNENLLPIGKFDTTGFPLIDKFCAGMETKEVELFNNTKEMEIAVKNRLLANNQVKGRAKRDVTFTEFPSCTRSVYNEVVRCYEANRPDLITLSCRILNNRHCSYKVTCKSLIGGNIVNKYQCPNPVHSMTQIYCCTARCKV